MEFSSNPGPKQEIEMRKIAFPKRKRFFVPMWVFRTASMLLIMGVFVSGAACKSGYGRLCVFDKGIFGMICPLGFLGAAFASKSLLPELWLSVGTAVLLIILLGRFFCAWVCPASIAQTLKINFHLKAFRTPKVKGNTLKSAEIFPEAESNNSTSLSKATEKGNVYSGLTVLVGALASSYLFGFPVFCMICPVGLTFGTIFAVMRWFSGAPPGLELVVFPVIIIVEFMILKSWCRSLCPLGALLGLVSRLNFFLRPKVQKEACLASRGVNCRICEKACPQGVTLVKIGKDFNTEDCTKCLECYEKCPTNAIKLKLF